MNIRNMGGGRRRTMKSSLCIPKLRGSSNNNNNNNAWFSPMSLLERFREAVFRLIMLTALSKTTHHTGAPSNVPRTYYPPDQHHNEAVADCIEFLKKSALSEDENRSSSDSIDSNHLGLPAGLQVL